MAIQKSKLRSAVTSSVIRRSSPDLNDGFNEHSSIPKYSPFDEPKGSLKKEKRKGGNISKKGKIKKNDIKYLSQTEIKILREISLLVNLDENSTGPVYLEQLKEKTGNPITSIKKIIQKLEVKGFINRVEYKAGRGGWTIYSIPISTRDKLETN